MHFVAPEGVELITELATGTVFHVALVRETGRELVCKRLVPRARDERAGRAAMVREAMVLARAHHPSLPSLRRVGHDSHGPFLIESRVEGVSMRALVEGWRTRGSRVPPTLVAHIAEAAAGALAELHALADEGGPIGMSHGDLGPDHVILSPLGEVRFVDLGAARFAAMDLALESGDRGTLPFVAPEVARGEVPPNPAADVYALAATLLFLSTGEPLTETVDEGAMLLEIGERGIAPSLVQRAEGLSERGKVTLLRALALDQTQRMSRASELALGLSAPVWR